MFSALGIGFGIKAWVDAGLLASVQIRVHLALPITLDALLDIFVCHWATRNLLKVVKLNVETGDLGA